MSNIIEPATADIAVTLEILQYTSQLENVVHVKAVSDSIFDITLEGAHAVSGWGIVVSMTGRVKYRQVRVFGVHKKIVPSKV